MLFCDGRMWFLRSMSPTSRHAHFASPLIASVLTRSMADFPRRGPISYASKFSSDLTSSDVGGSPALELIVQSRELAVQRRRLSDWPQPLQSHDIAPYR